MAFSFRPKGHDGKTADLPCKPDIPKSPVISKTPFIASAMARCGGCGTGEPLVGRPGAERERFECRTCRSIVIVNDGRGFKFEGWN